MRFCNRSISVRAREPKRPPCTFYATDLGTAQSLPSSPISERVSSAPPSTAILVADEAKSDAAMPMLVFAAWWSYAHTHTYTKLYVVYRVRFYWSLRLLGIYIEIGLLLLQSHYSIMWFSFFFFTKVNLCIIHVIKNENDCVMCIYDFLPPAPSSKQTLQHRPGNKTGSSQLGFGHSFLMLRQSVRPAILRFFCT